MASYPSGKTHRPSRRKLGRGQFVQQAAATVAATASTVTVSLVFDRPVVVDGTIEMNVQTGIALVSQVQTDATHVTQVYLSTVAGKKWAIAAGAPVRTFQGGSLAPASGTFSGG